MGEHKHLSDEDIAEFTKKKFAKAEWDGKERREAINSSVDPHHERRRKEKVK